MRKLNRSQCKKNKYISLAVILFLFYYSYRYIFRYNSSTTSPTYSDTPVVWQLAKYIILIIILLLPLCCGCKLCSPFRHDKIMSICAILLFAQGLYAYVLTEVTDYLGLALVLLLMLAFSMYNISITKEMLERLFLIFLNFTIIYEIVELLLYFTIGRLPALAYNTGNLSDVRFGGAWDAPNEYAVLLAFYFPYVMLRFHGLKKVFYLFALIVMEIFTFSITGWISVTSGVIVTMVCLNSLNTLNTKKICRGIVGLLAVLLFFAICSNVSLSKGLVTLFENKRGSIEQHLSGWDISVYTLPTLIGIIPSDQFSEVGWIRLISMGGFICLAAFLCVLVCGLQNTIKKLKYLDKCDSRRRSLYASMLCYEVAFFVACFNLPMMYSFSNMGLLCVFMVITCSGQHDNNNKLLRTSNTVSKTYKKLCKNY